jgi:pimeloyl-ACP methyl ester carboxylesterase
MGPRSENRSALRAVRLPAAVIALFGALMVLAIPDASAGSTTTGHTGCVPSRFAVKGNGPVPETNTVAGALCGKDPRNKKILLITSHGATYNHTYWDWPQSPDTYSFVKAQAASVSVLNIDLLGSGQSGHPSSATVTQQAEASMLHQLVGTMRARGFKKIVLVGHSSGSGLITLEASTYHDVDGLIVTGFLHRFAPPPRGQAVPLSMYPAALDPAFAKRNLDPGYVTTRPGTRSNSNMFYDLSAADPKVIAYDEAHKDVVTVAHAAGFGVIVNDPSISRAVNVPVLSLQGDHDGGFCDSPDCPQAADESSAWSPSAQLELHVIANAGHDIHLHRAAAPVEFSYVREWINRRFN